MATNYDLASIGVALDTSYNLALSGLPVTTTNFNLIKTRTDLGIYNNSVIWPINASQSLSAFGGLSATPPITFQRASSATRVNERGIIEVVNSNVPRFDYDPVTLQSRGLLIENTRTNLLRNFYSNTWSRSNNVSAVFTNPEGIIAPDGTTSGVVKLYKLNDLPGELDLVTSSTSAWAVSSTYVFSTYVRTGVSLSGSNIFYIKWFGPASTPGLGQGVFSAVYNLSSLTTSNLTPTYTVSGGGVIRANIQPVNNQWYRCSFVFATPANFSAGSGYYGFYAVSVGINVSNIIASGLSGNSIYHWGPQLEQIQTPYDDNLYPSSYIPTTTTSATRFADGAYFTNQTGLSTFLNQVNGTWVVEYSIEGNPPIFSRILGANSPDTYIGFESTGRVYTYNSNVGGGDIAVNNQSLTGVNVYNRAGFSYTLAGTLSGRSLVSNGSIVSDTKKPISGVGNTVIVGGNYDVVRGYINGHIRQLEYYNIRVPDNTLQTLTVSPTALTNTDLAQFELDRYLARIKDTSSITKQSKNDLFNFIKGCLDLGIWYNMVCWPLRLEQNTSSGNTVYSLGGAGTYDGTLVNSPLRTSQGIDTVSGSTNAGVQIDNISTSLIANAHTMFVVSKGLESPVNGVGSHNAMVWGSTGGTQNGTNIRPKDFINGARAAIQQTGTATPVINNTTVDYTEFHSALLAANLTDNNSILNIDGSLYPGTVTSLSGTGQFTAVNPLYIGRRAAPSANFRCVTAFGMVILGQDVRALSNDLHTLYKNTLGKNLGLL